MLLGAWVALLLIDEEKIILSGTEKETSHNRMELLAVIKAIDHVAERGTGSCTVKIFSDSQYVVQLPQRLRKLALQEYRTKAGKEIRNIDLVRNFRDQLHRHEVEFKKIKAHQKNGDELNREVDLLVRQLLRKEIKNDEGK